MADVLAIERDFLNSPLRCTWDEKSRQPGRSVAYENQALPARSLLGQTRVECSTLKIKYGNTKTVTASLINILNEWLKLKEKLQLHSRCFAVRLLESKD